MLIWFFIGTSAGLVARGLAYAYLIRRGARVSCFGFWPEILGGLLALLLAWRFSDSSVMAVHMLVCIWILAACLIDMAIREIPDIFTLGGLICGLFFSETAGILQVDYVFGAICSAGAYHLLNLATKRTVLGFGDVKFAAFLGGMAGLPLVSWFIAESLGTLIFFYFVRVENIPFAPVMSMAYLSSILL